MNNRFRSCDLGCVVWKLILVCGIVPLIAATGCTSKETSLREAIKRGDKLAVQQGLAEGVDPNHQCRGPGNVYYSFLHRAAECGHLEIVKLLVEAGADPDSTNFLGKTPLLSVVAEGTHSRHLECLKYLLQICDEPSHKDIDGNTALHIASYRGIPNYVDLLLAAGLDPDERNNAGMTPLHYCMGTPKSRHESDQFLSTVNKLLDANADPTIRDNASRSVIDVAREYRETEALRVFAERGFIKP